MIRSTQTEAQRHFPRDGRLDAGTCLFKPVAMAPNEVVDAAVEINSRVQIGPLTDQNLIALTPRWRALLSPSTWTLAR